MLMLFHPDDLQHRADAPIAWYSEPFAYQPEAAAGRLAAFGTGGDGGFEVRLTTGTLTQLEAGRRGPACDFALQVRHGRVLLDNSDALPGLEQMQDPTEADTWFELPNGAYRVTVQAIDRGDDGAGDPAIAALPDYVISFAAIPDLAAVPTAPEPPWLVPGRDAPPAVAADPEAWLKWPASVPDAGPHRFLASAARLPLPGQAVQTAVALADLPTPFGGTWLMAPVRQIGALAALVRHTGQSSSPGGPATITLTGQHVVRIGRLPHGPEAPAAEVQPVPRPAPDAGAEDVAVLVAAVLRRANPIPPGLLFELDRLRSLRSAEAVTTWALRHLDLPDGDLLALYAMPVAGRVAALLDRLGAGARFRATET